MKALLPLLFVAGLCACSTASKKEADGNEQPTAVNAMPNMVMTMLDGSQLSVRDLKQKSMIVVFRPECDHCQRAAAEIKENLPAFGGIKLYFVTSEPMDSIRQFASNYGLAGVPNVFFGWTSIESVLNNFGSIPTPSIYIYSDDQQLVKSFNGEVPITSVLPFIP